MKKYAIITRTDGKNEVSLYGSEAEAMKIAGQRAHAREEEVLVYKAHRMVRPVRSVDVEDVSDYPEEEWEGKG